ncbi:hypothetical protein ACJJTC_001164 [Scirpophaga incertulas]
MDTTYRELFKLYDLIQCGELKSVESFLNITTININEVLPCMGISVLHLAVGIDPLECSKKCTELLLKCGGNPNLSNDDGITPVHIAAIWGRVDNLKLLIGCGGDPSLRDMDGHSAFDYAAREQQWEVFDYLHNVIDQLDDSLGSGCAYTLDLDKVLLTTDQFVAEYVPVERHNLCDKTEPRKSEMIREWCEKTSLVINKLYPTILNETYLLENVSIPWKSMGVTKNDTHKHFENNVIHQSKTSEINDSFKTCLSKVPYEVEISGIHQLEITKDQSTSCSCLKQNNSTECNRMSIYENFSLPGSPNSIMHRNYNTKTSLKKCKQCVSSLCTTMKQVLTLEESSLLTNDKSKSQEDLDTAMVMVQNKSNEFLSSEISSVTDLNMNTRRSSASSGVSSNYSGGSIIIASMEEEYKYEDKKEHVVFIEKRLNTSPLVLPLEDTGDAHLDHTIVSVASSLPASVQYDNNTLRAELIKLGFTPGPIQESNKTLYLKKLQTLKKNPIVVNDRGKTYSVELEKSFHTDEWMKNLTSYIALENKMRADFANTNKKWREGSTKTSFTYLLLDPRLTDNLPLRAGRQPILETWKTFVNSIFYVGKGKRSRPYSHLYQAQTLWTSNFKSTQDKKVQKILDIWSDQVGVICLHVFQNVIPAEAYTNEAAMIDVLGLGNLKNLKTGNYYGIVASWPLKERRMLGLYLLYKALQIFLSEGERQLRPDDID